MAFVIAFLVVSVIGFAYLRWQTWKDHGKEKDPYVPDMSIKDHIVLAPIIGFALVMAFAITFISLDIAMS